jgi:aryl-alcohol dehydrogenase-like predicted oxidoreductase
MTFGPDWGWGADAEESERMFARYAAAGGNFVDTANNYTDGTSEELVGRFTSAGRDRWVIATKYTLSVEAQDPNAGGNHRKSLVRSLEQSLRRLGTDYVDLLWLHMHDATTPIEEAVRALDDQVRLGKVLYVGVSDSPAWVVARANTLADLRGWSPFVALQIPYSVANRQAERELLPMAASLGLALVPWGVLGAGVLSGKPTDQLRWPEHPIGATTAAVVETLREIAAARDATPAQVAIAWLLGRRERPPIIPLVAARTEAQIAENLRAAELTLDDGERERLDAEGAPELGFPRAFLESDSVRELIYGETWARLQPA